MDYVLTPLALLTFPNIDPVIFSIGPLSVKWYGLGYVAGIVLGWWLSRWLLKQNQLWPHNQPPMTIAQIDDFVLYAAIGIVLGGRLGYILFYDFANIAADPLRALQIWNGGMSFHGGFLGTFIAMIWFAKRHQINAWSLFDIICTVAPIGLFFGRIANFINGELWGRLTDAPWAMVFPTGGPFARHPSQLYQAALEGIALFTIMLIAALIFKTYKKPGLNAGLFVAFYGIARIISEFYREPDAHIGFIYGGWMTQGMLLSLPMILVGIWAVFAATKRDIPPKIVSN